MNGPFVLPPQAPIERDALDWDTFAREDWDRRPVLFKGVLDRAGPFRLDEVYRSALVATRRSRARLPGDPDNAVVTLDRLQQLDPAPWMPQAADGSLAGYRRRMLDALGARRYALVISAFHSFHRPLWRRERAFFAPLWRRTGLPLTGAITTLFHGNYESTPVGVHRDRFATFMVPVEGRKRMRFWAQKPWTEAVSTLPDYRAHLATSFLVEAGPGDLLYWPADYYHVGESVGGGVSTSVNIGIPRTEHRPVYDLEDLLVEIGDAASLVDPAAPLLRARMPAGVAALWDAAAPAPGHLPPRLPPALEAALGLLRAAAQAPALAARVGAVSLQRWSAGGFEPVPPLRRVARPPASARLALRPDSVVLQRRERGGWRFAADGHGLRLDGDAAAARALLARLRAGGALGPAEAVRDASRRGRGERESVLRWLLATGALQVRRGRE
ncbi:cupin domain-containing protein [Lysobacter firmicutimachus]|uniref:Cupin domain-containing protein n=2 Tax=Lysobacter TaxID=68 RepID=A0AAU8MWH9_9GAMM